MFLVLHPSPSEFEIESHSEVFHGLQAALTGYTTNGFIGRALPDNGLNVAMGPNTEWYSNPPPPDVI